MAQHKASGERTILLEGGVMTGLLLLFVTGLWLAAVVWLSKTITKKLPETKWRNLIRFLVFAILLPLPVIDELVGGWQFRKLCEGNTTIQVDRATAAGRTVYYAKTDNVEISGTWVRVVLQPHRLVDATTGEIVVSFNDLIAGGGRFIQTLGISEGGMPLTFKGSCTPVDQYTWGKLLKDLNITVVRRPEENDKTGQAQ